MNSRGASLLDDGRLLVPTRLVRAANAAGKNVTIEVAGTSLPFAAGQVVQQGEVSLIPIPNSITLERWPTSEINTTWSGKEVMLVVNQELNEPIAIDASRVAKNDSRGLHLISSIPISEALEGSAVTDAQTGRLSVC